MSAKRIWACSLCLGCCLLLAGRAGGASPQADEADRACRLVEQYGAGEGGPETIGSLLDLNMRQWKPQSNRGIHVLGWRARGEGPAVYRVAYVYEEMGLAPVEVPWRVDLTAGAITPLTPLSERMQKMARLL